MTKYAVKELNGEVFTPLKAETLEAALKEAETLIRNSASANIVGVWEYTLRPQYMKAVWVPGRGGWTNM